MNLIISVRSYEDLIIIVRSYINLTILVMLGCYTDSKVALYWMLRSSQDWKQFIENWVTNVCGLVLPQHWNHCPDKENPANIPQTSQTTQFNPFHRYLFLDTKYLSITDKIYNTESKCESEKAVPYRHNDKTKESLNNYKKDQNFTSCINIKIKAVPIPFAEMPDMPY